MTWTDHGPVLIRYSTGFEPFDYATPKSPCTIYHDSLYYLFWKGGVGTRYAISDDPLNFRDRDSYFLEPSHASEIVDAGGRWIVTSCSRLIYDFDHSKSDRTRGLFIAEMVWNGRWPVVIRWREQ